MSKTISTDDIKRLAHLARLNVPETEMAGMVQDITAILGFVDTIQSVQLDGSVTETSDEKNVFRDDDVHPIIPAHDLVEAAPLHQDHFVKVPKVIE